MIRITRQSNENPDFKELVYLLDVDLNARYGLLMNQYNHLNKTDHIPTVVVAYCDSEAIACGCFKKQDDNTVEMKRVFVKPEYRNKGVAASILLELEKWASELGFTHAVLETGMKQFEAIHFYHKIGYSDIENYGPYIGNTNSVCMRKHLSPIK
jgi:putative acetyltransferase